MFIVINETWKDRLEQQKIFWIIKIDTLVSFGLSQDLNWIHFMQTFCQPPLFFISTRDLKLLTPVMKWRQISL